MGMSGVALHRCMQAYIGVDLLLCIRTLSSLHYLHSFSPRPRLAHTRPSDYNPRSHRPPTPPPHPTSPLRATLLRAAAPRLPSLRVRLSAPLHPHCAHDREHTTHNSAAHPAPPPATIAHATIPPKSATISSLDLISAPAPAASALADPSALRQLKPFTFEPFESSFELEFGRSVETTEVEGITSLDSTDSLDALNPAAVEPIDSLDSAEPFDADESFDLLDLDPTPFLSSACASTSDLSMHCGPQLSLSRLAELSHMPTTGVGIRGLKESPTRLLVSTLRCGRGRAQGVHVS